MTLIAVLVLTTLCWLAGASGRGLLADERDTFTYRALLRLLTGWWVLYFGQWLLHLVGLPWTPVTLLGWLLLAILAGLWLSRGRATPPGATLRFGWGDGVALVALLAFAFCALKLWIVNPDFIYHWGIKAEKYHLAQGFDVAFLSQRWDYLRHPDYPQLLPAQLAAFAIVGGKFAEPALMLPSVLALAGLLVAARQVLAELAIGPWATQATMALLGLVTAMFAVGYLLAGSPDLLIALVPLAAWPLLLRREAGLQNVLALGLMAAIAAGAKTEGLPLAAVLVAVFAWTRRETRLKSLVLAALPTFLVALPWLVFNQQHGLTKLAPPRGSLRFEFVGTILDGLVRSIQVIEWHGFAWLLLALPFLVIPRATRLPALLCLAQLGLYLVVYLTLPYSRPEEVSFFVQSNFPRLAFHLMPTVLVACGVVLARWPASREDCVSP